MMYNRLRKIFVLFLVTAFFFNNLQTTRACGPFTTYAIFSYAKHPELPLEKFARGEIGVLKPNFARSYLSVAYRYFNNLGLNSQEQADAVELWNERLTISHPKIDDGVSAWLETRKKIEGVAEIKSIDTTRRAKSDEYDYFENCLSDAFNKAAETLQTRINKSGANSQEVKDWVAAQDKVFANCSEGQTIPEEATSAAPASIKTDRSYQIAAAYFYSANFDEAKTRFERIVADSSSPYNATAALLVARSLIRKASLENDTLARNASLVQAETQLNKVLADRSFSAYNDAARSLLSIVQYRLRPTERLRQLAVQLSKKDANENFKQDLWDYTLLLDKVGAETDSENATSIAFDKVAQDDLTDWLFTFQDSAKGFGHALERWRQTSSQAWLMAALTHAKGTEPNARALIQAAERIQSNAHGFYHANYHLVRLLIEQGKVEEARSRLDTKILNAANNSQSSLENLRSSLNQFLSLRMAVAASLEEFLKYAQRKPGGFTTDDDGNEVPDEVSEESSLKEWQNRTLFDHDATNLLNENLPLSVLQAAAQSSALPAHLRQRVAIAVWTRAVILDRDDIGKIIAPTLAQLAPELKTLLDQYVSAPTAAERKNIGLYIILKFPAMRPYVDYNLGRQDKIDEIDSYRDNWWCEKPPRVVVYDAQGNAKPVKTFELTEFLTATQKAAAQTEVKKLLAFGTAPNYLAQQAVLWGQRSPNDARVPEALHLSVKSTRYGCTDDGTGKASKAAHDFLHKNYPATSWAKQTPYWFK